MSIQFSKTTTPFNGIIQLIEDELGYNRGDISGNSDRLAYFTTLVNLALDDYFSIALTASGRWQLDDSNQTDLPIIKTDIVAGQRDYSFTVDGSSNLILDIERVAIFPSATATLYEEIIPIDQQSDNDVENIVSENTARSVPYRYDKTANSIILDPIPSYSATSGLKVYINREAAYFTTAHTDRKPGVPGIHHKYFVIKATLDEARRKSLSNFNLLEAERIKYEGDEARGIIGSIERYFGKREKDVRNVMRPKRTLYI